MHFILPLLVQFASFNSQYLTRLFAMYADIECYIRAQVPSSVIFDMLNDMQLGLFVMALIEADKLDDAACLALGAEYDNFHKQYVLKGEATATGNRARGIFPTYLDLLRAMKGDE